MARKRKQRRGTCEICGAFGEVSRDHLPPEGLFEKPLPMDLLTVAACSNCNGGSSGDDEYFRNAVCMSTYRGDSRHAIAGSDKSIRSLQRSARHRDELSRAIRRVPIRDANGQIKRMGLAFDVDADRINAVVRRIARGVFFKETGRIFPNEMDITVDTPESFDQCDQEAQDMMLRMVLVPLKSVCEHSFADGLFRYKFANPDADSCVAVWWMVFYNTLPVLCLSGSE